MKWAAVETGEELRLNTDALRLQQDELRHQVEETKALVKHTESQARTASEMFELERARYQEAALPKRLRRSRHSITRVAKVLDLAASYSSEILGVQYVASVLYHPRVVAPK